MSEQVGDVVRL